MWATVTTEGWREDLDWLAAAVAREHARPFHTVSPDRFHDATLALRRRLPGMAPHEVVVGFARLLALVGDGHSALRLPAVPGMRRLPVALYRYEDGTHVRRAMPDWMPVAGWRVEAIGGVPVATAWEVLRPLASVDNAVGAWSQVPELMTIPEVLHAVGLAPSPDAATLVLRDPASGESRTVTLPALDRDVVGPGLVDARRQRMADPLWLQGANRNWFTTLDTTPRTLYLGLSAIRDSPAEPLATLFERAFAAVDAEGIERIVIDLRHNHGGNMALNRPLVEGLSRRERLDRWGGIYVVAGRRTFSAAMNLCVELEARTHALFAGEPTGARPGQYGENADLTLPRSGLRATISCLWWAAARPYDDREWITPDLPAPLTIGDELRQRDPALDAILAHDPAADSGITLDDPPDLRLIRKLRRTDLLG